MILVVGRTILPLVERNSWRSSTQREASVKKAPVDPKDEKLQVRYFCLCCEWVMPIIIIIIVYYARSST